MAEKCLGGASSHRLFIEELPDKELMMGIARHADPSWWRQPAIQDENQAYLRHWGTMIRREARRRGLL